jgi:hypothetical protein
VFYYTGLNTATKRFLAGSLLTGSILYFGKPTSLFYEDGSPRPWSVTTKEEGGVFIPWWFIAVAIGGAMGVFI